jgi:probable F420-dependent oxidoreductase
VRVGVFSPTMGAGANLPIVAGCARAAEELGFATIWQGEHVVLFDEYAPAYPFTDDGVPPLPGHLAYLDPMVSLAMAAAVTSTIHLGTATLTVGQHNPVLLAKQAATLDVLSDGRLVLGAGLGWSSEEYAACGVPFARRGARTDEYVDAMRRLWLDDVASYEGDFVRFADARCYPKPRNATVPIYFGGGGERMFRRIAATGDGWLGYGQTPEETARSVAAIREQIAAHGRDLADVEIVMAPPYVALELETPAGIRDKVERYAEAGVDELALLVPPARDPGTAAGTLERLATAWLAPAAETGARSVSGT